MLIFVDIDGTICTTVGGYDNAVPILSAIHKINRLYEMGHNITYWTARGKSSGIDWSELTNAQLKEWGCLYHKLSFDKPAYDCILDDKALRMRDVKLGVVGGISGIYKIESKTDSNKFYIGSAKDIIKRGTVNEKRKLNMNIWTNGCFDILHTGHLALLTYAKFYGSTEPLYIHTTNRLFVGVDSDERVKMLKGDKRPINGMYDRAKMIEALRVVDSVVIFNNDDELRNFIRVFNIDYMVIGDQYKDKVVIGAECSKYGVIYYPTDEHSTTNIIEKIKNL